MKAKELIQAGELKHKVRTIKDLAKYIEIKENKDTSNYSIFLGAGASRSSGILTAFELIVEWMEEIYERHEGKSFVLNDSTQEDDLYVKYEKLKIYFERNHSSWFDATNPYSSLFEKKFDLAPQRRRFIEKEVDGKLPSIGYAYLVSLVKNNYFNAIFTTNFDDLINEAFYQLSDKRPIVCAHDSSVHSISVTSQRPKIIKLHGDYLFEDIKSTLRETESLENNIRQKLIEFCKEYGLIVIGYSGNDRSIMDTLEYLIKSESYLKNGVYWCLREEDEVNPKLRSFFWKDGVYPVIIKGFDEFFNELHHELLGSTRVFNTYNESKQQKIIQQIIENKEYFTDDAIKKDIEILEYENETQSLSAIISEGLFEDNHTLNNKATIQDHKNFLEIDKVASNNIREAYERSQSYYSEAQSESLKTWWIAKLLEFSKKLNLDNEYKKWADELIKIDCNNFDYHIPKLKAHQDLVDRLEAANKYKASFSHNYEYLNYVIKLRLEIVSEKKEYKNNKEFLDKTLTIIESSISLEPSLRNKAWLFKVKLFYYVFLAKNDSNNKEEVKKKVNKVIREAKSINKDSIYSLTLETHYCNLFDDEKYATTLINDLYARLNISSKSEYNNIIKLIDNLLTNTDLSLSSCQKEQFYTKYIDIQNLELPIEVMISKIYYLFLHNYDLNALKRDVEQLVKHKDFISNIDKIVQISKYIDSGMIDKFENILISREANINPAYFCGFMALIKEEQGKIDEAIEYLDKKYTYIAIDDDYFSRKSFLLLKKEDYMELDHLFESFKKSNYDFDCEVLVVNTMYSYKIQNSEKYDESALNVIISKAKPSDKLISIAAKLIIDKNRSQALSEMKKLITNDRSYYLIFNDWVIIDKQIKDSLQELIRN